MGELPAPCPQLWELGLPGPRLTGAGQLQSRPGREHCAYPGIPGIWSSRHIPSPEAGLKPLKGLRGRGWLSWEQGSPHHLGPFALGRRVPLPTAACSPKLTLQGGWGGDVPPSPAWGGRRGQGCPDPLLAAVCVCVYARL